MFPYSTCLQTLYEKVHPKDGDIPDVEEEDGSEELLYLLLSSKEEQDDTACDFAEERMPSLRIPAHEDGGGDER